MSNEQTLRPNAVVQVGNVTFAQDRPIAVFAGPCQMESRAHALEMATALKEIAGRLGLGLVYKTSFDKANRTSLSGKRGVGLSAALDVFAEIRSSLEGAWWDFVDEVATQLIRSLVINHPKEAWPTVDRWVDEEDMWLRRSAIICQVGAKDHTDPVRLFRFCELRIAEKEFFIRKAIGWSLREYAKTDPNAVADFINAHREELSGLSFREGSKHIKHLITE
jgi:hypothetical protein